MNHFCYCSPILPGKEKTVVNHWQGKHGKQVFWEEIGMHRFDCWLQKRKDRLYMIHGLEGPSLTRIFEGLRSEIAEHNPEALALQNYYLDVLGKDYSDPTVEPKLELLLDMQFQGEEGYRRGFFYPLLPDKEEGHRAFCKEATGAKRSRHEASLRGFGVSRFTKYLQTAGDQLFLVNFVTYRKKPPGNRLLANQENMAWREIAELLSNHTGLAYEELSPDITRLTA